MHKFKDHKNREWLIELTIGSAKRVKDLLGINLLEPESGEPPLLTRIGTDVMLLCDIIFVLIKPQADKNNITTDDFIDSVGGDVMFAAQKAFYDELSNFFRSSGRTDRAKMMTVQLEMIAKAAEAVQQRIGKIDLDKEIEKELQAADKLNLSGN